MGTKSKAGEIKVKKWRQNQAGKGILNARTREVKRPR